MYRHQTALRSAAAALAALLFALPYGAKAGAYISATAGSGPNGYQSSEVRGNADLFDTPLSVNALSFKSDTATADSINQSAVGLNWKISELAKLGVTHNQQDNSLVDYAGNSLNLSLALDTLWQGVLQTRLDLKRAASAYHFNNLPPRASKFETINQTTNSIGLSQDLGEPLTLYVARDMYNYDNDPRDLATFLMRKAPRKFRSASSNLLSFPDTTSRFGLTWRATDALTLDVSSSRSNTQLDQELKTSLLGIDYQATSHLNIYAAVSKATSTAVVTKRTIFPNLPSYTIPAGTTVIPATDDTYTEFSLGWTF